jgi:Fur family transcriptional regulator, stress-responsive regulator
LLIGSRRSTRLKVVPTSSDLERMLRGVGLRVTRPRTAVLSAVHDHPHADTESLLGFVRQNFGGISHQAVYDVLRALTETGLVRRFQPTGSLARYEARVGDNHHHVVCRSCGAISDVDCAVGDTPCLTASDPAGYEIDEAEVIYWGRCTGCAARARAATDHLRTPPGLDPGAEADQPTSPRLRQPRETTRQEMDRRV